MENSTFAPGIKPSKANSREPPVTRSGIDYWGNKSVNSSLSSDFGICLRAWPKRTIVARMGFLDQLLGGNDSVSQPPALPKFDYELMYVRGKDAVKRTLELREEWAGLATPVIVGTQADFSHLTDLWGEEEFAAVTPQDYLESAGRLDLDKWFADHSPEGEQDPEYLNHINKSSDWNTESGAGEEFSVVREVLSRKLHPWVLLGKIPTPHACQTPAYLKFGGWNECPEASVHVAAWRKWQDEYGAKILCVSGDIIEATVARPPVEKSECYKLAREQFVYCNDIVGQGVGSIDALAATLRDGKSWYFWWD
jgi:hypothetical protein